MNEKIFFKFVYFGDFRIRGSKVVYVFMKVNMKDNKYESIVVVEDFERGIKRFVENVLMLRIFLDGKKFVFMCFNEEKKEIEIWVVDIEIFSVKKVFFVKNICLV